MVDVILRWRCPWYFNSAQKPQSVKCLNRYGFWFQIIFLEKDPCITKEVYRYSRSIKYWIDLQYYPLTGDSIRKQFFQLHWFDCFVSRDTPFQTEIFVVWMSTSYCWGREPIKLVETGGFTVENITCLMSVHNFKYLDMIWNLDWWAVSEHVFWYSCVFELISVKRQMSQASQLSDGLDWYSNNYVVR